MTSQYVPSRYKKNIIDAKLPDDLTHIIDNIKSPSLPLPEFYLCNICGQLKEKGLVKPCANS